MFDIYNITTETIFPANTAFHNKTIKNGLIIYSITVNDSIKLTMTFDDLVKLFASIMAKDHPPASHEELLFAYEAVSHATDAGIAQLMYMKVT